MGGFIFSEKESERRRLVALKLQCGSTAPRSYAQTVIQTVWGQTLQSGVSLCAQDPHSRKTDSERFVLFINSVAIKREKWFVGKNWRASCTLRGPLFEAPFRFRVPDDERSNDIGAISFDQDHCSTRFVRIYVYSCSSINSIFYCFIKA